MYKILVPTDGSEISQQAVKQGMVFAKALNAKVFGLHVIPKFHAVTEKMDEGFEVPTSPALKKRVDEESKARAREILAPVEEEAKGAGLECECIVETNDAVYEEILDAARKKNCDLIIMASHGHAGVTGLLLGSETAKVLTHAKLPVLILR
ncbi:MAG: universal stress protein [Betaproteobacteria bacterium]|nr:universal stress protein [Betaproteobacteria bacterium]